MKGKDYSRPLAVLFLSSILLFTSCELQQVARSPVQNLTDNISQGQQVPTLQSGLEIPVAHYPLPLGNDIYVQSSPGASWGDFAFFRNPGGGVPYKVPVEVTTIFTGDRPNDPSVQYRSHIVTKAGQIRYNIIAVHKPRQTGFQVDLRLTSKPDNIGFYLARVGYGGAGPAGDYYQSVLVIDVPLTILPGDYKTDILVFLDGEYLATLPCTIQVTD